MIPGIRTDIQRMIQERGIQDQGENLSLYFHKLCPGIDDDAKSRALSRLEKGIPAGALDLYRFSFKTWESCCRKQEDCVCVKMETRTPLIIGMGDQNIHETGISLQPPWGTPFIPGSAIKGILSSYAGFAGGEDWHKPESKEKRSGKYALEMFGGTTAEGDSIAGCVDFADAWWVPGSNSPFQTDIITPHYSSYYRQNAPRFPDGTDDPVPINIITIRPGESFLFVIRGEGSWRNLAVEILKKAAGAHGFGSKTRLGYGRFSYQKSLQEVAKELETLGDAELAALYEQKSGVPELREAFRRESRARKYSPPLKRMFLDLRPAFVLLEELKENNPGSLKKAGNIRKQYKKHIKTSEIEKSDPDIRAVYEYCLPLAQGNTENTWLAAFEPSG